MGFFDKLKMGAGEEPIKEGSEKKSAKSALGGSSGKPAVKKLKIKQEKQEQPKEEMPIKKIKEEKSAAPKGSEPPAKGEARSEERRPEDSGRDFEGELAIDVYETDGYFIVQSTIAGVKAGDLDITIENDIVTIRGSREKQVSEESKKYYYQECYWGAFSRQVILPEEVEGSKAEAAIKDGVLTLKIPKIARVQKRKIAIKQED